MSSPEQDRIEEYMKRYRFFDMSRTLKNWLSGFPSRVSLIRERSEDERMIRAIEEQFKKVKRARESVERTNGKTIHNLVLSAEKLNTMLCDEEGAIR